MVQQRRPSGRGLALLLAPWACLFASPYALDLPAYYNKILIGGHFKKFVTEWAPTTLTPSTAAVYLLILGGLWLLGREGREAPLLDQLAFVLTSVLAFEAVRNTAWIGLVALAVLPPLVDRLRGRVQDPPRMNRILAVTILATAAIAVVAAITVLIARSGVVICGRIAVVAAIALVRIVARTIAVAVSGGVTRTIPIVPGIAAAIAGTARGRAAIIAVVVIVAVARRGEKAETENAKADAEGETAAAMTEEMSVMAPAAVPAVRLCRRRAQQTQGEAGGKYAFHRHAILLIARDSAPFSATIAAAT